MPRPWSAAARRLRQLKGVKRKPPEPIRRWKMVRGDSVEVLAGKDKGKQGKLIDIDRKLNRVFVQGLNTHLKYTPPRDDYKGGYIASEAPLHYSKVALVDPADMKRARIGYQYRGDGEKVRVSNRTGTMIPKPLESKERRDFKTRNAYKEGPKDTRPDDVQTRTYRPSLLSFEEEILSQVKPKG
ncbi:large ribosomal subunit protein uL24m-like [Oscarella lobularis]|uniref:large ribosomal subunit protein uL24m-like n=1 Tax=Oscarella lobularis TaxID=121494 RepID=UPI0033136A51